jgi:hypothetical protein
MTAERAEEVAAKAAEAFLDAAKSLVKEMT